MRRMSCSSCIARTIQRRFAASCCRPFFCQEIHRSFWKWRRTTRIQSCAAPRFAIWGSFIQTNRSIKEEVLNSYFLQNNAGAIVTIARVEKDPELKRVAVSKLSIMHSKEATDYLMEILQKN